jgi:cysteinyl-tRNA synthetase
LRRYFLHKGYKVRFVSNITDVGHLTEDDEGEDKVAKRAKLEKLEPMEVAEKYTWSYFDAMAALNVLRPSIAPRASGHIPEMWELTQKLLERGVAYVREGSVYFRVRAFPEYGKLSGKRPEELRAGARVEVREEKEDPLDFALWKRAEPGHLMRWKSPWGEGYPGWHIECTAMSLKYLGEGFDLHAGGIDLQFPHQSARSPRRRRRGTASPGTGCTTTTSSWRGRRWPRARGTWSSSTTSSAPTSPWPCAFTSCRPTTGAPWTSPLRASRPPRRGTSAS